MSFDKWIANFTVAGSVRDADFQMLLSGAESWVIAQASMQTGRTGKVPPQPPADRPQPPPQRLAPAGRSPAKPKKEQNDAFADWDV